jgi:hypothetical protein
MIKIKTKTNALTILIVITLLITTVSIFTPKAQAANDDSFSIMQISDTQFLSASFPQLFINTTNWIVSNAATYNLKMVVHTGDIVDNINGTSGTYSDPVQWDNANAAMIQLLNAGIPYCWDAGNHDQIPWNDPTGTWLGSSYSAFNASNMRSKPYWVSDLVDSKNTAVKFTSNGYEFLIINIEYMASNTTITWMKNLLDNNKGANVIVGAHTYLNKGGGYGFSSPGLPGEVAWATNFKTILDGYPNIFLTLSGHDPTGTANMTRVGNREEVFFDRQSATTAAGQTGAAAVRIYTFNMTTKMVNTTTYSLDTQSWLTTASNQFSFNANLKLPLAVNVMQSTSNAQYTSTVSFNAYSSGGVAPYTYQWYQGTNIVGTNSSLMQFVAYPAGNYVFSCKIIDADGATATTNMTLSVSPLQSASSTSTPTAPPTTVSITTPTYTPMSTPTPTSIPQTTNPPSTTATTITVESTPSMVVIYTTVIIVAIVFISLIVLVTRKRAKQHMKK